VEKKKVEFTITNMDNKCNLHPQSSSLLINDEGIKIAWCLECLYKMLSENDKGQWNVETEQEKS
jgi:hypothetical protein